MTLLKGGNCSDSCDKWYASADYSAEVYSLERSKDTACIEVLGDSNEGEFVRFDVQAAGEGALPVVIFGVDIERSDATFDLKVVEGQQVLASRRIVLKASPGLQAVRLELPQDQSNFEGAYSLRVRIAPIDYSDNPTQVIDRPMYRVAKPVFGGAELVEESLSQLTEALEVAQLLLTKSAGRNFSDEAVADFERSFNAASDRLNTLKSDFDYRKCQTEIGVVYDFCSRFEGAIASDLDGLIDAEATLETRNLYENLKRASGKQFFFGMHDATGYGVGWRNDDDRSDVNDVCGDFPSIFSWDLFELTFFNTEESLKYRMERAYRKGGINTMCWHQYDPLGYGFYQKSPPEGSYSTSILGSLLEDGEHHDVYVKKLRTFAEFFKSLRGDDGEAIPVLFRPFHEMNGTWFWWGRENCTKEEYIELWKFTVRYLRDELNVHNLIYVFSPDAGQYEPGDGYFDYYPGDEYVDVLGFDSYWDNSSEAFKNRFTEQVRHLSRVAKERGKVAMLTEVGDRWDMANGGERLATTDWFTRCLLDSVLTDEETRGVVGAITWRNDNPNHHFNPYPGHPSVPDFLEFYENPFTAFLKETQGMYRDPE